MHTEPGLSFATLEQGIQYDLENCYPAQIARALGYNPVNRGISGGSNDAMFRLFLDTALSDQDIVIACWTGVNRSEIYTHQWQQLCPGDVPSKIDHDYFKQWVLYSGNTEVGMFNKTKNILALNALAQARGIPVINIDSFWKIDFWPKVDFSWPDNVTWPTDIDFMTWCEQHDFAHTPKVHFFKSAHDSYAQHVLENLRGRF